jgi:N-acetyl sugar amidotransferase
MKLYKEEDWKSNIIANNNRPYQQCAYTLMDTISDPYIVFDEKGVSNYYYEYKKLEQESVFTGEAGNQKIQRLVSEIKKSGKGKKYDCITGVSGGVDSTYVVWKAKQLGLNPLIVHFDNGWNSELAVQNIQNIISILGFDLYTLVVEWNEFKDIQLSYFKANVVDIEAITDHAIIGTLYKLANQHGIKYILSGANIVTEGILPKYWIFNKADGMNIKDIHDKFGKIRLKTYPFFSTYRKRYYLNIKGIKTISLLNYLDYNKTEAKDTIRKELNWRDYGGKHQESIFTKFYQNYILPVKFGIDKRKAHLSTLIASGQISKDEAVVELSKPIYEINQLKTDIEFVLKKLGLSQNEFDEYLQIPRREHIEFRHERGIWDDIPLIRPLKPIWKSIKKLRNK